jgi:hypothetical protein
MLWAVDPTAFTYAGTDPSMKSADLTMNRQAIALLRPAGLTIMPPPSRTATQGVSDQSPSYIPARDERVGDR